LIQEFDMSGIDQFLADRDNMINTAAAEFFVKTAMANGISPEDIQNASDEEIQHYWQSIGADKVAAQEAATIDKVAAANIELAQLQEEKQKEIDAVQFGKTAAEAFVAHRLQIEEALEKEAAAGEGKLRSAAKAVKDYVVAGAKGEGIRPAAERLSASRKFMKEHPEHLQDMRGANLKDLAKSVGRSASVYGGGTALVGGGAYGAHRALKKDDGDKEASALDALAAELAVKKAAAYNFDPQEAAQRVEAVLTLVTGESEKVAYVNDLDTAVDVRSSELLELAGYPIDWSGTIFAKEAADEPGRLRRAAKYVSEAVTSTPSQISEGLKGARDTYKFMRKEDGSGAGRIRAALEAARRNPENKELAKGVGKVTGAVGVAGGGAYGAHRALKKDDDEKQASVQFDTDAAALAVKLAADAGHDPEVAAVRLQSLFNLGYEGDPTDSTKVASASDSDTALYFRACELLEMASYKINW